MKTMKIRCRNPKCSACLHLAELPEDVLCCPYCGIMYVYQDMKDAKAEAIREENKRIRAQRRAGLKRDLFVFAIISFAVLVGMWPGAGWRTFVVGHPGMFVFFVIAWFGCLAGYISLSVKAIKTKFPYRH